MLRCVCCGTTCEPLDLANADGVCGVCGAAAVIAAPTPEPEAVAS